MGDVSTLRRSAVARWMHLGLDLLFPPQCVGCRKIGFLFCPNCAQAVDPLPASICFRCGRFLATPAARCANCLQFPAFPFEWVRAASVYAEPLRSAIHALKYEGQVELAVPLARYLLATVQQPFWASVLPHVDGCVPVPLHPRRLAMRGYNQSALLASALAESIGLPFQGRWVERIRETESQTTLSAAERLQNVDGAFAADPAVAGKRLILVDDVTTTGATLTACAAALKAAGAQAIYGLVLAMPHSSP